MAERIGILSRDLWALRRELSAALDAEPVRIGRRLTGFDSVLGWTGSAGRGARAAARISGAPFRSVSSGPLCAVRPERDPPMSLTFGSGNRTLRPEPPASRACAVAGLALLRRLRLSWRNDGRDSWAGPVPPSEGGGLALVVLRRSRNRWGFAAPDIASAVRLIAQARRENPGAQITLIADEREPEDLAIAVAALQPGTAAGKRMSPWGFFDQATTLYADPGDLCRLAVMAGLVPRGPGGAGPTVSPEDLFRSAFLDGTVWFDAWSRRPASFETAAGQLAWLRDRCRDNAPRTVCVGISRWKADAVARLLEGPDGPPLRSGSAAAALDEAKRTGGRIVAWETRMPGQLPDLCRGAGVPLIRMEDGFLRSVGLGAAFLPGASAVLDSRGIYYDPGVETDLEHILATHAFPQGLLDRAAELRRSIVRLRLSKYNVGHGFDPASLPADATVILAPGQVEDDASIILGAVGEARTNLGLLQAARRRHPDAFLLWKPHPDVAAGLRAGSVDPDAAAALADRTVADISIAELLDRVDAVETMTSLAGFEALLRGKRVAAHGRPFYAGWGLTEDLDPVPRRTRRLSIDELVAGALILYPRYLDPVTGLRCPPEILVERLAAARAEADAASPNAAAARLAYARLRHALFDPIASAIRRLKGVSRPVSTDP